MTRPVIIATVTTLLAASFFATGADKPQPTHVGTKAADFTLPDPRAGKTVGLAEFREKKAIVLLFLGTECPINNNYMLRVTELHRDYDARGVQFLAIYSNEQDGAERVAAHARKYELPFPVLRDAGQVVADRVGAQRVPEALVLDAERRIRYQGRIDDRFGIGYQKPRATRHDLAEALDEVLAGKAVSQPAIPVAGCLLGRAAKPKSDSTVTYAKQVSRIVQEHCQECHRPGQVGPMALLTYDDASAWAAMIREVVQEGRMPPWHADPRHGKFSNDRSLPRQARETLLTWIDQGCPKGDDKDLPPPRQFATGWNIGKPDAIFTMPNAFEVPAETPKFGVPYQYFSVQTNFLEDRWIVQAEARPGAPEVVHHIIVFIVPPGEGFNPNVPGMRVLCGTAPGDMPFMAPAGMGKKLPAGSKLVFQMHYTPSGRKQKDQSSVGVLFAREPVERQILTMPVGNRFFRIPPGDENHKVEAWFGFKEDALILSYMPHLHLRGKSFLYEAVYPDGKHETLLSIPRYNFNWQSVYRLETPLKVSKGMRLHCVAHYDNSAKNPSNPDPTKLVTWGDQTWEEMMIGWIDFVYERKP